jgi:WD40 repeat protein
MRRSGVPTQLVTIDGGETGEIELMESASLLTLALALLAPWPPDSAEVNRLIERLGNPTFAERKAAGRALDAIGEPALLALERAADASPDAEVREGAGRLRAGIRARVFGEVGRFEGSKEPAICVAYLPDGHHFMSGEDDGTVRVWHIASGKQVRSFRASRHAVWSIAITPDGKRALTAGAGRTLGLWNIDGREVRYLTGHGDDVSQLALSADGTRAISGSRDTTVRLWDVTTGQELWRFGGHREVVSAVAISPDGRIAVSGCGDIVRLWDAARGKELRRLEGHRGSVWALVFSPDGKRLVSGSTDGALQMWEVASGKLLYSFRDRTCVNRAVFTPDGRRVLTAAGHARRDAPQTLGPDPTIRVWDAASGEEVYCFRGYTEAVIDMAVSSDGHFVLSAGGGGTIRRWRLPK